MQGSACRAAHAGQHMQGSVCRAVHAGQHMQGSACRAAHAGQCIQGSAVSRPACHGGARRVVLGVRSKITRVKPTALTNEVLHGMQAHVVELPAAHRDQHGNEGSEES